MQADCPSASQTPGAAATNVTAQPLLTTSGPYKLLVLCKGDVGEPQSLAGSHHRDLQGAESAKHNGGDGDGDHDGGPWGGSGRGCGGSHDGGKGCGGGGGHSHHDGDGDSSGGGDGGSSGGGDRK